MTEIDFDPKALGWQAPHELPDMTNEERRAHYHANIDPVKPLSGMLTLARVTGNWSKFSCARNYREDPHDCSGG